MGANFGGGGANIQQYINQMKGLQPQNPTIQGGPQFNGAPGAMEGMQSDVGQLGSPMGIAPQGMAPGGPQIGSASTGPAPIPGGGVSPGGPLGTATQPGAGTPALKPAPAPGGPQIGGTNNTGFNVTNPFGAPPQVGANPTMSLGPQKSFGPNPGQQPTQNKPVDAQLAAQRALRTAQFKGGQGGANPMIAARLNAAKQAQGQNLNGYGNMIRQFAQ